MYVEGSDAAVLHPSIGLNFWALEGPGAAVALARGRRGWAPYWLYRLDEQVHGFGGYCPEMRLTRATTSPSSAG